MWRRRKHQTWVAWLAMLAIGLAVIAPVVSQTLTTTAAADSGCPIHALLHAHHAKPDPTPYQGDCCGYCSLLCHSPLLPGAARQHLPALSLPPTTPTIRSLSSAPSQPLTNVWPRGPPALI